MKGGPFWWICTAGDRWHAWPANGGATVCGAITTDRLRAKPAKSIKKAPPAGGLWCRICARHLNLERRSVSANIAGWVGVIKRQLTRMHVSSKVPADVIETFATLVAEIGQPDNADAGRVFEVVLPLFFGARRKNLRGAVEACPKGAQSLAHIAACVTAWHMQTSRTLAHETFTAERVITTMLRVKDPAAYVRVVCDREHVTYLAAVWHPDRLARMERKTEVRGTLAGGESYWQNTADQLRVLTD